MCRHRTDYQIRVIMKEKRGGSPDRQKARHASLMQSIRQLQARGYGKRWDIHKLRKKELHRLVHDWRSAGLNIRTIANHLVNLRWHADKVGRLDRISSNRDLGIKSRRNMTEPDWDRARELDYGRLGKLAIHAQLVIELRREFGLRAAEAMKFQPEYATCETEWIRLAGSWSQGGRPRKIRITTDRKRDHLDRVGQFQESQPPNRYGERSMIPVNMTLRPYGKEYIRTRFAASVPGNELRYAWAHERFEMVMGFPPTTAGSPEYSELPDHERSLWNQASSILIHELGIAEGREDPVAIYIGSSNLTVQSQKLNEWLRTRRNIRSG